MLTLPKIEFPVVAYILHPPCEKILSCVSAYETSFHYMESVVKFNYIDLNLIKSNLDYVKNLLSL